MQGTVDDVSDVGPGGIELRIVHRPGHAELSNLPAVELGKEQPAGEGEDCPCDGSVGRVGNHAPGLLAHAFPPPAFGVRQRCLVLLVGE